MADAAESKVSLITEDGSCVSGANCYVTLDFADSYMRDTGRTDWSSLDEETRKACLINATKYIDSTYSRLGWKGARKYHRRQSLDFPRVELFDKDGDEVLGIPEELKQAVCEAAFLGTTTDLFTVKEATGSVKRQKVDVLEVEYFSGSEDTDGYISRFTVLDYLLSGLYKTKSDRRRVLRAVHTDLLGGRL